MSEAKVVDITIKNSSIYVISQSPLTVIPVTKAPTIRSFKDLYRDLPPEIQRVVGTVDWPSHNALLDIVDSITAGTAIGASDGSVRPSENKASHAWIITTPQGGEIVGRGPVDGSTAARTSHRAEL